MFKIRKLQARDRLMLYKVLQQNEHLNQKQIERELLRIDEFLFDQSHSKIWVVVVVNNQDQVAGYASYGLKQGQRDAYVIFNILISPVFNKQSLDTILLRYIENEIAKKHGRLILAPILDKQDYE